MINNTTDENEDRDAKFPAGVAIRFGLYTLVMGLVAALLPHLVNLSGKGSFFAERGPVEILQVFLLFGMVANLLLHARSKPDSRELSVILAAFPLFAACRELDFLLDQLIPVIGWKIAGLLPLGAAWFVYARRQRVLREIQSFVNTRSFSLLWSGCILVVIVAQLLGNTYLFETMMGDQYDRIYKRFIEESAELLGYIVLFCGTIEYRFCLRKATPAALPLS